MGNNRTFDGLGGMILIFIAFLVANPAVAIGMVVSIFLVCLVCNILWKLLTKPRNNPIPLYDNTSVNYFERGIKLLQENKPKEAINVFTNYLKTAKSNIGECYFYRGLAYTRLKNNQMAVPDLKKAQELLKDTNKEISNNCEFLLSKISIPSTKNIELESKTNNKVTKKVTSDDIKNKVENNKVINLQKCSKKDILTLIGFDEEKASLFINKRKNGKMWYDIDSFVQDFNLQPHEMVLIQDRLVFPPKPNIKIGKRKIDI